MGKSFLEMGRRNDTTTNNIQMGIGIPSMGGSTSSLVLENPSLDDDWR